MHALLNKPLSDMGSSAPAERSALRCDAPGLEALLGPCPPERFFAHHWRQQLLHVPKQPQSLPFDSLLPLHDIDHLFAASTGSVDDWFFFRAADNVGRDQFVSAKKQVELNGIIALYRDGGTIHLRNTQRFLPSIERFWRAMSQRFRAQVSCNLWVTSDNRFDPFLHYDTHDIFILQLHGRKRWTTYACNAARFAPFSGDVSQRREDVGEPTHRLDIKAGDMLYVPAGMPHEVTTLDPHSVHLAVGVFPLLWRDVLDAALADLDGRGSSLVEAVPTELLADVSAQSGGETLRAALRSRLLQAADEVNREALLATLAARFVDAVPPPEDGHFVREVLQLQPLAEHFSVQADTLLQRRADAPAVVRVNAVTDEARILFPGGGRMQSPAALAGTLRAVAAARGPFRAEDLPQDFDLDSRILLLDELRLRGLLTRAA